MVKITISLFAAISHTTVNKSVLSLNSKNNLDRNALFGIQIGYSAQKTVQFFKMSINQIQ